ncbi:hypothetical protein F5141DRAFT_1066375 [Pisolithus sp. B1]|nr:hypothetical protein F5141DRAFT_1066375 [Pisolithus sp. B1]
MHLEERLRLSSLRLSSVLMYILANDCGIPNFSRDYHRRLIVWDIIRFMFSFPPVITVRQKGPTVYRRVLFSRRHANAYVSATVAWNLEVRAEGKEYVDITRRCTNTAAIFAPINPTFQGLGGPTTGNGIVAPSHHVFVPTSDVNPVRLWGSSALPEFLAVWQPETGPPGHLTCPSGATPRQI